MLGRRRPIRSGPSPAECLIPQMQETARRKRYQSQNVAGQAPSKLIGYVSAGALKKNAKEPVARLQQSYRGRLLVVALALGLLLIWLRNGGI